MINKAYFIQHCDDPDCSLGTLEFDCPNCNEHNVNYENFYDDDKLYRNELIDLNCEHCDSRLTIRMIDYENIVEVIHD